MGKLHEILAVESDQSNIYRKLSEETITTFSKKPDHFKGFKKRLEMFNEADAKLAEASDEQKEIVTTVHAKLDYFNETAIRYLDVVLQKEATNQLAKADIEVDGAKIAIDVPATFLLGLEDKLAKIREVYAAAPTIDPGVKWDLDANLGEHVYRQAVPEKKHKTAKQFKHQILVQPTDKHPAQVEKWEEQVPVGQYIQENFSGMISPAEKSALLGRIDKLIMAVKQARQRANTQEVVKATVGKELLNFIMGA